MPDNPSLFPYQTVAVTGGTGSFGWAFLTHLRHHFPDVFVRIISRHEDLQVQMRAAFGDDHISYLLGDVRDLERMRLALRGVDLVVHAAALKHVDRGEYEPWEFLSTNVTGTYNVIHAAITAGVQQVVMLSSDKSVFPVNLYGASKMAAERLTMQSNHYSPHGTRSCVVRYGNIMGARGSVVKAWREALSDGKPLLLTDERMSRFWMSIEEAVRLVLWTAMHGLRGGIVVPYLPAFKMLDLLAALGDSLSPPHIVGKRPGEKLAEYLLTDDEQERCYWYGPSDNTLVCYVIPPLMQGWGAADERALWAMPPTDMMYGTIAPEHRVPYRSDTWRWQLGVEDLRQRLASL